MSCAKAPAPTSVAAKTNAVRTTIGPPSWGTIWRAWYAGRHNRVYQIVAGDMIFGGSTAALKRYGTVHPRLLGAVDPALARGARHRRRRPLPPRENGPRAASRSQRTLSHGRRAASLGARGGGDARPLLRAGSRPGLAP